MLKSFFAAVPGSIQGLINFAELQRSVLAGFGASSLVGLALAVVAAISADAAAIFPSPAVAMAATFGLAQLADLIRRLGQGATPGPVQQPDAVAGVIYRGTPVPAPAG